MRRYPRRGAANLLVSRPASPQHFQFDGQTEVRELQLRCAILSDMLYWKTFCLRIAFAISITGVVVAAILVLYCASRRRAALQTASRADGPCEFATREPRVRRFRSYRFPAASLLSDFAEPIPTRRRCYANSTCGSVQRFLKKEGSRTCMLHFNNLGELY
jgi:hypothetical protein